MLSVSGLVKERVKAIFHRREAQLSNVTGRKQNSFANANSLGEVQKA